MIIHDFYVPRVSVPELESDPPPSAGRDRPLAPPAAAEAMQAHRRQSGQVIEALGFVEQSQTPMCQRFIEAGKAAFPLFGKSLRRPVGP